MTIEIWIILISHYTIYLICVQEPKINPKVSLFLCRNRKQQLYKLFFFPPVTDPEVPGP